MICCVVHPYWITNPWLVDTLQLNLLSAYHSSSFLHYLFAPFNFFTSWKIYMSFPKIKTTSSSHKLSSLFFFSPLSRIFDTCVKLFHAFNTSSFTCGIMSTSTHLGQRIVPLEVFEWFGSCTNFLDRQNLLIGHQFIKL